ncbi:MAG: hypothetical protein Q9222_000876 [Ikaeria aurantiellina]
MHCHSSLITIAALGSLFPALGASATPSSTVSGNAASALKPININDFETAAGIQRRAAEGFSHLDPSTQAHLIYGRPGKDGQLLLANMTLYAQDGLQMVMMERFEPLTSAVDCKGDDGSMSLTFKSQAAFQHALDTWNFINQAPEKEFLLIANHDGCGPQDERQAYRISHVQEDQAKLTTYLTAQPAPWSEIAGTYDLDFGRAIKTQQNTRKRGIIDDIGDAVGDAGDFILHGDADLSRSVTIPVAVGEPGVPHSIVDTAKFSVSCTDCYVTGSFQVTGHLSVSGFKLQDFTLAGSPQDFAAKLQLATSITAPYSPDALEYTKELFSAAIPDAGISVAGIFSLGTWISYEVGVSTTFAGSASMTFGLSASLPNGAMAIADVRNPSASSATGFEGGQFDPNFDLTALSSSVTVAAFSQPKLLFGIDIERVGRLDIALAVKLPTVSATLKAAYNESGLCSADPSASKTGAQLSSNVAVEVDLNLDANLGSDTTPAASLTLFKKAVPLFSKCIPIEIPGLQSGGEASTAVDPSSTASVPTASASAVSVPLSSVPTVTAIPVGTGGLPVWTDSAVYPSASERSSVVKRDSARPYRLRAVRRS